MFPPKFIVKHVTIWTFITLNEIDITVIRWGISYNKSKHVMCQLSNLKYNARGDI
jgi:hypothetical protein